MTSRRLTDRTALAAHRARAEPARGLFLHEIARDELHDRLRMVNRRFTAPAVVCGLTAPWQDFLPAARCVDDSEVLDLAPEGHDLVVHAMALQWADDPVGQMIQCLRALRPDGLFLAVLPGGQTLHELRSALAEAEVAETGGLSPRVLPMADVRALGDLMQRAGFAMPVADSLKLTVSHATALDLMHDLRAMGEANAMADRLRRPTRRAVFLRAARIYAERWSRPDGRITASFELVFLCGWRPHPSQPRPLRPGSAAMRLADALGAQETPLPDHPEG